MIAFCDHRLFSFYMKSVFRLIGLFFLASLAVLVTFGVLFYNNPSWQKAALMSVLEQDQGREYSIESVSVKTGSIHLENAFVLQGEQGIEVKELGLVLPLWKVLQGEIVIEKGLVSGLKIDLSNFYQGDPTAADWLTFVEQLKSDPEFWRQRIAQLLSTIEAYGYRTRIENLFIEGEVLLPYSESVSLNLYVQRADTSALESIQLTVMNDLQAAD